MKSFMIERLRLQGLLVENKNLALEMAYAEKPYREMALNVKKKAFPSVIEGNEIGVSLTKLSYYASINARIRFERFGSNPQQVDLNSIEEIDQKHQYIVFAANAIASEVGGWSHMTYLSPKLLNGGRNIISPDITKITVAEENKFSGRDCNDRRYPTDFIEDPENSRALRNRYVALRGMVGAKDTELVGRYSTSNQFVELSRSETNLGVVLFSMDVNSQQFMSVKKLPFNYSSSSDYQKTVR